MMHICFAVVPLRNASAVADIYVYAEVRSCYASVVQSSFAFKTSSSQGSRKNKFKCYTEQ